MAALGKLLHVPAMVLLVLLLLLGKSPPGEARPVAGLRAVQLSATTPAAGVALPRETLRPELDRGHGIKGCAMAADATGSEPPSRFGAMKGGQRLREDYAPLLLNLLPRGAIPPSAPGKQINDMKP